MKDVTGEIKLLMYRHSTTMKTIKHVTVNGKHVHEVRFEKFIAGEEFRPYNEEGEHCFITFATKHPKNFYALGGEDKVIIEVTKEEGNEIYKQILKTKTFDYEI